PEWQRGKTVPLGQPVPLRQGQRPDAPVGAEPRFKGFEQVAPIPVAKSVAPCGQDVDKLARARRLKVEHPRYFSPAKEQVVGKQIAMDDAFGQPLFLVLLLVRDLVIQDVGQVAKVGRQLCPHLMIPIDDALEAETVLYLLLVSLTQEVERRQNLAGLLEVRRRQVSL